MKLDIIGDIHGCYDEFFQLTKKLEYTWEQGYPIHPDNRRLAFIGDITDRGPQSLKMIETVYSLVITHKKAYYVPGNHCNKLYRFFIGRNVQISHGLETTVTEFQLLSKKMQHLVKNNFIELYEHAPLYQIFNNKKLIIAHAGLRESDIGKSGESVKTFVLYGDITGEKHADGSPVRRDWAKRYTGNPLIVYGHTPVKKVRKVNQTYNIDTGAVFGGKLSALRYPELTIVDVPSSMPYVPEKFTTFVD